MSRSGARACLAALCLAVATPASACSDNESPANSADSGVDGAADAIADLAFEVAADLPADTVDVEDARADATPDAALDHGDDVVLADTGDEQAGGDDLGDVGAPDVDAAAGDVGDAGDSGEPVVCGGFSGDTCSQDQYCDFPDDICGAADGPGICLPRPGTCTADYRPVCGCDGEVHSNPCRAAGDGTDVSLLGGCTPPEGWTSCGSGFCLTALSYCLKLIPGMPGGSVTYSCQTLPDCADSTSCDCVAGEGCVTSCEERDDGGLLVTCAAP